MSKTEINLKDFGKELESFSKKTIDEQKELIVKGIVRSAEAVFKASPVDTGLYASSWDLTVEEESVLFGNFAPHAPIIEHGARPFTPPLAPLLAWAKRVLKDSSQPPDYSEHVWALAVGTQKKISREGMQPKHVLKNAIPVIIENIKQELRKMA